MDHVYFTQDINFLVLQNVHRNLSYEVIPHVLKRHIRILEKESFIFYETLVSIIVDLCKKTS